MGSLNIPRGMFSPRDRVWGEDLEDDICGRQLGGTSQFYNTSD